MRGHHAVASEKLEILTAQDVLERAVYTKALSFFDSRNYAKVIELLHQFYNEKYKTNHLVIIELLARAHRESTNCVDYQKRFSLPLWKALYAKQISQKHPDYENSLTCIIEIIQCHLNDQKEREGYIKMALKILNVHEKAFFTLDSRGRFLSNEKLKEQKCLIYFIIATFHADSQLKSQDAVVQNDHYIEAKKYYLLALEQVPGDLKTIINLARLNATHMGTYAGINILLPFTEKYITNRSFNESMRKLYLKSGQNDLANQYKKRSDLSIDGDEMSYIFNTFEEAGDFSPDDDPRKKIGLAQKLILENKVDEAKLIAYKLIEKYPNYVGAYDLMLRIELSLKNTVNIVQLCKKILEIKPDSLLALSVYADYSIKSIDPTTDTAELYTAYHMYEKVYQAGGNNSETLFKLIFLSEKFKNYPKVIEYSLESVRLRPTPPNYFILAQAYASVGKFNEAIEALRQVRLLDKNYQNSEVSLRLIDHLLRTASTKRHLMKCAKKFDNYLMLHNPKNPAQRIFKFKKIFEELKIEIPYLALQAQTDKLEEKQSKKNIPTIEASEKLDIVKQDDNWHVPAEIKAKISELLKNLHETGVHVVSQESKQYDPLAELQSQNIKLYSIGGNSSGLFAYMSPHAKTKSAEEAKKFRNVFRSGKLLAQDSQDEPGIKPLSNGKFSNKPCGIERRMLTNGIFMAERDILKKLRVNIPITDQMPNKVKILKFEPIKNHARLNK